VIYIIQRFDLLHVATREVLGLLTTRGGLTRRMIREAPEKIHAIIGRNSLGGLVGWAMLIQNGRRRELIVGVYVRRWARGAGIGRALVEVAVREARRIDPSLRIIQMTAPKSRARHFFEHLRDTWRINR
jgi:GNAT superfamily N-acetyltransferase